MTTSYRLALRAGGVLIAAVSFGYMGLQLRSAWPQLATLHIEPLPALLALVCAGLSLLTYAQLWRSNLQQLGSQLSRAVAARIWFTSQLVRYAPGNVWHMLGRAYLSREAGAGAQAVGMSMVLELLQTITAALLVAALSLLFWRVPDLLELWTLLLVPLLLCYCWPSLLQRPLAWVAVRFGRGAPMPLRRRDLFALLPGYCATWLAYGCGFFLLARAIHPLPLATLPQLTGIFAIAWVIGFMSFITPSGLGVREGVLGYLLSALMPLPAALLLALLARVWLTVAEIGCAALVVWRRR